MSKFNMTGEMQSYFNSLPINIQQELVQSGVSATSLKELKSMVNEITLGENEYDGQL